jgi:muramoyltetrapeptide carboxypeptidase
MSWNYLKEGDVVDLIAPGYGVKPKDLTLCIEYIESLGLTARVPDDLLGDDIFSSNSDNIRTKHVIDALTNTKSQAIWCLKGGYGSTKIVPALTDLTKPKSQKLLIGFSDITALHLFVTQKWNWQSLHAPVLWQVAKERLDQQSITALTELLFGKNEQQFYNLIPLNNAKTSQEVIGEITGGNMMLVQSSIGTDWRIRTDGKIVFLEDVDERAYRVERTITHLQQAHVFDKTKAIILGDFEAEKSEGQEVFLAQVLDRFAARSTIPVYKIEGIGHGKTNYPLPLNCTAIIETSNNKILINNK